ncbi:L-histidine N(alpha)-methyltransferase [Vibrio ostreicida]|uniref:L-histidine N(alpha)-methyltransferase n=1 Tax=Vibrio ostreicida TaxID=526588 RepID=UPI003B5A91CB
MENLDNQYGSSDPIAVIGLACQFPKAPNIDAFWHNLTHGLTGQSHYSQQELEASGIAPDMYQREHFVASGANIENPEYFDAALFGYSPTEARSIDPQQRLFLHNVWHAIEHSGYAPTAIQCKTGVFGSIRTSTYSSFEAFDVTQVGQVKGLQALLGNDKDYLATRVAHKLNLTGPAFTVQTACSSSLVAVHLACESLRSGECDMAIAGGVAVSFPQKSGYEYQPGMIFSPDGLCRPFDANANGTFGGHGVGSVVLKRLDDALRDGDTIQAVLRGSAINNDGQDKVGFTAPSVSGQVQVLKDALNLADLKADDVGMIEAHGTGTKLGDPIEVAAIKQAYQRSDHASPCILGSVKSSLGHLDTAAGIASLIKTVLSVSRGKIPASLNLQQPNPALKLEGSGFDLAFQTTEWSQETRTAAVSSFGIGGTNCHMLVQSAPKKPSCDYQTEPANNAPPLLISANSMSSLRALAHDYAEQLNNPTDINDIAYSAINARATDLPYRLAVRCDMSASTELACFAQSQPTSQKIHLGHSPQPAKVTWCFTGQGSQFCGMGQQLYLDSPAFQQSIDDSQLYCRDRFKHTITEVMFGEKTDLLRRTDYAQLAIVAFEIALAKHWLAKGITPDAVMGHSVGELSACVIGGYLSHQMAIELVAERGRLMHRCAQHQSGSMLAVFVSQEATERISSLSPLDLAACNGHQHHVFSGLTEGVEAAIVELNAKSIPYRQLDVPCAAHSHLLDDMLATFSNFTAGVNTLMGKLPLISSVTGRKITDASELDSQYWTRHVREPVNFRQATETAIDQGYNVFVEMGPQAHLTAIGKRECEPKQALWFSAYLAQAKTQQSDRDVLCAMYAAGINAPWPSALALNGRKCPLPLYPFDQQAYWYESDTSTTVHCQQTAPITDLPATPLSCYTVLRCCAIEDVIRSCLSDAPVTVKNIIRGGRLLPRYRGIVSALLETLVEQGYYRQQDQSLVRTTQALPSTQQAEQWLRSSLASAPEHQQIGLSDIAALIHAATSLKAALSRHARMPLNRQDHVEAADWLLNALPPTVASATEALSPAPQHIGNLIYLDWSAHRDQPDLETVFLQQRPTFVHDTDKQWQIRVSDTFSPQQLNQVAVHQINAMWGNTNYTLQAKTEKGHWRWLGDIHTQSFSANPHLDLLPSPHNRYLWQWQPIDRSDKTLTMTPDDIEQARQHPGQFHTLSSGQSLLLLPDGPLADISEPLAHTLSQDFEVLYVITSQAIKVNASDPLIPEKFALMSLLRVARKEYPNKTINLLDINADDSALIAEAMRAAPFNHSHELAFKNGCYFLPKLVPAPSSGASIPTQWFTTAGWHLVTGGMGGIGRWVIRWLAQSGARHIAVLGRTLHANWPDFCEEMAQQGCRIETLIGDLSQQGELEKILNQWHRDLPVVGAIHAAGTTFHGMLNTWNTAATQELFTTKASAFSHLYQWLDANNAQYLVGFSSAASLGAPGQGAYALANAYIEGFALAHSGRRCHVMSIGWGAWDNVGMTRSQSLRDKLSQSGMHTITAQEGLWHLSQSLLHGEPLSLAGNLDTQHANFSGYFGPASPSTSNAIPANQPVLHPPKNTEHTQTINALDATVWITERVRYQLGLSHATAIGQSEDLLQLGMDSLQFLELSAAIKKQFGVSLSAGEAYQDLSVSGLATFITSRKQSDINRAPDVTFEVDIANRHHPFPLTPIQHAYWIGRESWVKYGGIACNVVFEWDKLNSEFDPHRFESAWNALITRHDMLRMTVMPDGKQVVQAQVPHFTIPIKDLSLLDHTVREQTLDEIRHTMRHDVRPAGQWPLFDVRISQLCDNTLRLHMNLDLLQFDVQSFKIMMDDLSLAYQGQPLTELPFTFRDYVMHEQKLRQQEEWKSSWAYWQTTIPTLPKAPQLPIDRSHQNTPPKFRTLKGTLPASQWCALKSQWQQWGVTPSAGLLTLFAHTLAKWATFPEFTLNMTFFNRQPFHKDVDQLIGDFTSVLLMDFDLSQPLSLKQHMANTQDKLWQRLGHSQINGVEVIREMAKHLKNTDRLSDEEASLPLVPVVFTSMLGMSMDGMDIEQAMTRLLGDPVYVLSQTPQVWLDHQIMEVDAGLAFNWYCMEGVLPTATLNAMFTDYLALLAQVAACPQPSLPNVSASSVTHWRGVTMPEISDTVVTEVTSAWANLEHQALAGIWQTLNDHQLFVTDHQDYSLDNIVNQLNVTAKHHKLVSLWLDQLQREGVIFHHTHGFRFTGNFPAAPSVVLPMKPWCQRLSQYVKDSVQAHPTLLNGQRSALEILFKNQDVTDSLYRTNPSLQILNHSAGQIIQTLGQGIKVLEVGAGTASTSRAVLAAAGEAIHHYRFTDVSHVFLQEAKHTLALYPQVSYAQFDINQPPDNDLIVDDGYQVILAVNVLHDATNLPQTLERLHGLLAQDGYLIFIEATDQYSPMQLATVGFIEGLNAFDDFRQSQNSAMLTLPSWLTLLSDHGFQPEFTYPTSDVSVLRQHLVVAKAQGTKTTLTAPERPLTQSGTEPHTISTQSSLASGLLKDIGQIWSDMLGRHIDDTDDFFQTGGDSLMATKMIVTLNQRGLDQASLQLIFEQPVLKDFVAMLTGAESQADIADNHDPKSHQDNDLIRQVWGQYLNDSIRQDSDFFQSGGDSLMATKMIVDLQQMGFNQASLQKIFEHPMFADFCLAIQAPFVVSSEGDAHPISEPSSEISLDKHYPLTPLQNAYWLGESRLFSLGNGIAHFYAELEIKHLDRQRLTDAWNTLVKHHDQLRGFIRDGDYVIHDQVPEYQPHYVDLSPMAEQQKGHAVAQAREQIAAQGIPTDQWPLFAISILQLNANTCLVHLVIDLVVADGKSLNTLFQQWQSLYDIPDFVLEKPIMTTDAYLRERTSLEDSQAYSTARQYWRDRLANLPEAPALPLAETRSDDLSQGVLTQRIDAPTWSSIQRTSLSHNVLPSMTLLSAFCVVLNQWSATDHFSINVLHSNRQMMQPASESVIGNLSTTSMLECNAGEAHDFLTLVHQIQQRMSNDLANASFDGQHVLREKNRLNQNLSTGMPVVFNDTTSVGQHKALTLGKLTEFGAQTPHVYLDCMLVPSPCGGIDIKWTIQPSHLRAGVFDAMFNAYTKFVTALPSCQWEKSPVPALTDSQQAIRHKANATEASLALLIDQNHSAAVSTLCDMIRHGAEQWPDHIAITQGSITLSYQEMWLASCALASQIKDVGDDSPLVAIVMDKGWEQVIAAIGILLAGKAYMPVDASYPNKRIEALLQQGEVQTVVAQQPNLSFAQRYLVLVPDHEARPEPDFTPAIVAPDDLAYVIFTSGSTGTPKGVMMDHQAVVNTLLDINQRIGLNSADRVLAISALNFDLSVFDIFSTLSQGAQLIIPPTSPAKDPQGLVNLAQGCGATIWNSVPAFVQLLADCLEQSESDLPQLRQIMMSGDWIPVALPDRLKQVTPNADLLSLGGATEAAIWSICHPITQSYSDCASIPYGKPLANQTFYVLDHNFHPTPDWVTGELYIGGQGLAKGYWRDDDKTAAAFINHPIDGTRLYKTGDLGRCLTDGNIEFLGRGDHQVKINGYRIELGEIESTLRLSDSESLGVQIQDAIVQPIRQANTDIGLVAYVVYAKNSPVNNQGLLKHIRTLLPQYMCPEQIIALDSLPLTANGKVNRQALPAPIAKTPDTPRSPATTCEQTLAKLWAECLNHTNIMVNQSFFELGGHSLLAVRLINQINTHFNLSLTAAHLQTHNTIERLCLLVEAKQEQGELAPVLLTPHAKSEQTRLFIIHPIGGHLLSYQPLAAELDNVTLYGLAYPEKNTFGDTPDIKALAAHYLTMIQTIQPQGPYQLAGWSFGGVVAYELASQLTNLGQDVAHCVLIDSYKPSTRDSAQLNDVSIRQHFYADWVGRFPDLANASSPDFSTDLRFCTSLAERCNQAMPEHVFDDSSLAHLLAVYRTNLRAMLGYQPPVMPSLPVTLFAAEQNNHLDFMSYQDRTIASLECHGWSTCCAPDVKTMSGDHYTLLQAHNVKQLASELSQLLRVPLPCLKSSQPHSMDVSNHE